MASFSLEDEDMGELFLTQESRNLDKIEDISGGKNEQFLGVNINDFSSPCVSLVRDNNKNLQYSDISEDETGNDMDYEE